MVQAVRTAEVRDTDRGHPCPTENTMLSDEVTISFSCITAGSIVYPTFNFLQEVSYEHSDLRAAEVLRHQKAERWFKERRIKYQYIDLANKGLSAGEYRSVRAAVGYDALVGPGLYRLSGTGHRLPAAPGRRGEAAGIPAFRVPIVRNGKQATVGYCPDVWQTWEQRPAGTVMVLAFLYT